MQEILRMKKERTANKRSNNRLDTYFSFLLSLQLACTKSISKHEQRCSNVGEKELSLSFFLSSFFLSFFLSFSLSLSFPFLSSSVSLSFTLSLYESTQPLARSRSHQAKQSLLYIYVRTRMYRTRVKVLVHTFTEGKKRRRKKKKKKKKEKDSNERTKQICDRELESQSLTNGFWQEREKEEACFLSFSPSRLFLSIDGRLNESCSAFAFLLFPLAFTVVFAQLFFSSFSA